MEKTTLAREVALGASLSGLAATFGISKSTIRYWMKKFDLKLLRKPRQRYATETGTPADYGARVQIAKGCRVCGRQGTTKWLCPGCYTKVRRFRQKRKAVEMLGGKCSRCGWSGNFAALEFHHISGDDKDFMISHVANKSWEVIKQELAKCELLCSCCHRIEHSNNEGEAFLAAVAMYQGLG